MGPPVRRPRGLMLIELAVALVIGAIVLASLNSLVALGFKAQAWGQSGNDLTYQARYALERIVAKADAVAPQLPPAASAGTSGSWFSPTLYCLNANQQLIETTSTDTGCTGSAVLAGDVTAFSVQPPPDAGPVDDPAALVSLTLTDAQSGQTLTLAAAVRLGGGTL